MICPGRFVVSLEVRSRAKFISLARGIHLTICRSVTPDPKLSNKSRELPVPIWNGREFNRTGSRPISSGSGIIRCVEREGCAPGSERVLRSRQLTECSQIKK